MSYMPSTAFIAQALYSVGAETEWDDAPAEEQQSHMTMARVAIGAIQSWQAQHKGDGSTRYYFEPTTADERNALPYKTESWTIFDRKVGSDKSLGVLHDPILAQQVVDDLNRRDTVQAAVKVPAKIEE